MHPVFFYVGNLPVHAYGVCVALAVIAGLWTASRRGLREKFHPETIYDLGPWLIIGGLVGARALHVVSYWREEFADKPFAEIFMVWRGGLVFYGGFLGALLAFYLFTRRKKISFWKLADVLAPSIALGNVFGRIGCLLFGCCYGRACELPWAIHFPRDHETHGAGVHPTQLYDALLNLALYAALAWQFRRKKFDGQTFALFLMGYAIARSVVEMFRGDYLDAQIRHGLTPAQLLSAGIFVAGAALWFARSKTAAQKRS
ncbi:MAG: Phosphatidylglycerol--prolipoprotein diacylglyceryl transferase [Verrucomicrobiota bacterium]